MRIYISRHAKGRIYKRLKRCGIKDVDIRKYIRIIVNKVKNIQNRYIGKPIKFKDFKWLHGFFDLVVVDDYFRNTRIVVTIIF